MCTFISLQINKPSILLLQRPVPIEQSVRLFVICGCIVRRYHRRVKYNDASLMLQSTRTESDLYEWFNP